MRLTVLPILSVFALSACGGSQPAVNETLTASNSSGGTISYCRPSSIIRLAEYPTLYVEDNPVAQVKNGSRGTIPISLGQNFRFGLKPSALYMRMSEQVAYESIAESPTDRFFIVSGKSNVMRGLTIAGAGIFGAAASEKLQNPGKENWDIIEVNKQGFDDKCND